MIQTSTSSECNWYVVFCKSKLEHWLYRKVIDPEFSHVYAIQSLNDFQWLVVQPRINIVDIKIMLKSQYPHVKMITGPDAKVLDVEVFTQERSRGCVNFSNCTETIKGLLGIRSFWTWTPKQLYKGLVGGCYGRRR